MSSEPLPQRELRLMLAALPQSARAFRARCAQVEDWESLWQRAAHQGVGGILAHALQEHGEDAPAEARARAERELAAARLRDTWLRTALAQCLEALEAADLPCVALKGPLLGTRLYPDSALRPSVDLDLLVRRGELERAVAALRAAGFQTSPEGPTQRYYRERHHHVHLFREGAPLVELHYRAFSGFGTALPAEALVERARRVESEELPPARVLDPEDELLYLVLHAAGHLFERLLWLYDIKLLARRHPQLDWTRIAAAARNLGVGPVLAFGLNLLRQQLGVDLPEPQRLGLPNAIEPRFILARRALAAAQQLPVHTPGWTAAQLGWQALLCQERGAASRFLRQHLGRIARRRAQRTLPGVVPDEWSA